MVVELRDKFWRLWKLQAKCLGPINSLQNKRGYFGYRTYRTRTIKLCLNPKLGCTDVTSQWTETINRTFIQNLTEGLKGLQCTIPTTAFLKSPAVIILCVTMLLECYCDVVGMLYKNTQRTRMCHWTCSELRGRRRIQKRFNKTKTAIFFFLAINVQ